MFKTPYNYNYEDHLVTPDIKSETVPDQSYTVKELLIRYQSGIMPSVSMNELWDENPDFDNIDPTQSPDFDLSDYSAEMNAIAERQAYARAEKAQRSEAKPTEAEGSDAGEA